MAATMRTSSRSALSRGIFVKSPTIPGIAWILLGILHGGWKSALVPGISEVADLREQRFWKMVDELTVQAQAESDAACVCQGNVVARKVDAPEPVAFLEIAEAAPFLLAISEIRID